MRLVIVESPNKVKKIKGFLGEGYQVAASIGHVRDLPPGGGLNVAIVNNTVTPTYEIMTDKKKVIKELTAAARQADEIWLATDPDREGEAIAWHLTQALGPKHRYKRVTFNAITNDAIQAAIRCPREIDMHLVNAQQARRVLDRVVGWLVSPTCATGTGNTSAKSAGRVQSVALRIVAEREQEINNFKAKEYYNLVAHLVCPNKPPDFHAKLVSLDGKAIGQSIIDHHIITDLAAELRQASWSVCKVDKQTVRRLPPPPFTTSTVQQSASVQLHWRPDKTMKVLQSLFEGGHITYHRTDSTTLSPEGIALARDWIAQQLPVAYLPEKPNTHASKADNAQEAHEAIRPTHPESGADALAQHGDNGTLYRLIWQRFISSQMATGSDDLTIIDITAGPRAQFRARGTIVRFPGWRLISNDTTDDPDAKPVADDDTLTLPNVVDHDVLQFLACDPVKSSTKPPPRFTAASLIKALEGHGVGRPSTYAAIMAKLLDAGYVVDRARKLHCTELGTKLIQFLKSAYHEDFIEILYTRRMETQLDAVARGEQSWQPIVAEAAHALLKLAQAAGLTDNPLDPEPAPTVACPVCGKPMAKRSSARGPFLGCTKYPRCKGTVAI